jgi:riboflavin kinase/FMN adenylyltransferase
VVAIGTFDGVHLGHQEVVAQGREIADRRGRSLMVVTFEPNPVSVLRPNLSPAVITPVELKAALIGALDVDELLVIPFTRAFARIRAERFVEMLAAAPIGADAIVVGQNFRFGHGGEGTVETLMRVGRSCGLEVISPAIVTAAGDKPVSSTRIRRLIAAGEVAEAAVLLSRPYGVEGPVVEGAQRGRGLGFPTANVEVPTSAALPARGVYAGRVATRGGQWGAAINVGFAPTFQGAAHVGERPRLEAFLLDYDGPELYQARARVVFLERLRDERRFDGAEQLVAQIEDDVRRSREIASAAAEGTTNPSARVAGSHEGPGDAWKKMG